MFNLEFQTTRKGTCNTNKKSIFVCFYGINTLFWVKRRDWTKQNVDTCYKSIKNEVRDVSKHFRWYLGDVSNCLRYIIDGANRKRILRPCVVWMTKVQISRHWAPRLRTYNFEVYWPGLSHLTYNFPFSSPDQLTFRCHGSSLKNLTWNTRPFTLVRIASNPVICVQILIQSALRVTQYCVNNKYVYFK